LIRGSRARYRVIFGYSPQQTLAREPMNQRPVVSGGRCGRDAGPTLVSFTNISPAPASWSLRSDPPAPYSGVAPYCAAVSRRLPPRLYQQSSRAEAFSALSWVNGVLAGAGPTLAGRAGRCRVLPPPSAKTAGRHLIHSCPLSHLFVRSGGCCDVASSLQPREEVFQREIR
jgi:hypothetical protein